MFQSGILVDPSSLSMDQQAVRQTDDGKGFPNGPMGFLSQIKEHEEKKVRTKPSDIQLSQSGSKHDVL